MLSSHKSSIAWLVLDIYLVSPKNEKSDLTGGTKYDDIVLTPMLFERHDELGVVEFDRDLEPLFEVSQYERREMGFNFPD